MSKLTFDDIGEKDSAWDVALVRRDEAPKRRGETLNTSFSRGRHSPAGFEISGVIDRGSASDRKKPTR